MTKNIVICCDGTGNEFGDDNSNVIKLFSTLTRNEKQIAYYHPGVGTTGELDSPNFFGRTKKTFKVLLGKAFGYGIIENIADAYTFIMKSYNPGDQIFIFGFSRGAYTARAIAAMIHQFGIMDPGCESVVSYAVKLFKNPTDRNLKIAGSFKNTFGIDCKVHFLGVWDTVSSVGWTNPVKLPYTFHNPDIEIARHAISVDERRCFFRQHMMGPAVGNQDIKQIWFPGVHSDVGGGYPESESGLSKGALKWMLDEAEKAGIIVNPNWKAEVLGGAQPYVKPDFRAIQHNQLKGPWWIVEYIPKSYIDMSMKPPVKRRKIFRGSPRFIPEGSIFHKSFQARFDAGIGYSPKNVPKQFSILED